MGNAGYGNHDDTPPADTPGRDRAPSDGRDAQDVVESGAVAGTRPAPDPAGSVPHSGVNAANPPTRTGDGDRDVATPGDGAGPDGGQGGEVDPGTG